MGTVNLTLYLETTVPSYLTARPSHDVVTLAHQQITKEWWEQQLSHYRVFVSELVLSEAEKGDPEAARRHIEVIRQFPLLEITDSIRALAADYSRDIPLPDQAAPDALHLAVAKSHRMDYLLTWNCQHIARGFVKRRLVEINRAKGLISPTICTPEEMFYEDQDLG